MNDITDKDLLSGAGARSRGGWAFSAGLLVGLAAAIGGIALAIAAERRRQQRREAAIPTDEVTIGATNSGFAASEDWRKEDSELDEELAQTFPASDPLPASHRVD